MVGFLSDPELVHTLCWDLGSASSPAAFCRLLLLLFEYFFQPVFLLDEA